jgi:hypothetical protein
MTFNETNQGVCLLGSSEELRGLALVMHVASLGQDIEPVQMGEMHSKSQPSDATVACAR